MAAEPRFRSPLVERLLDAVGSGGGACLGKGVASRGNLPAHFSPTGGLGGPLDLLECFLAAAQLEQGSCPEGRSPGLGLAARAHRLAVEAIGKLDRLERFLPGADSQQHVGQGGQRRAAREDVPELLGQLAVAPGQRQRRLDLSPVGEHQAA